MIKSTKNKLYKIANTAPLSLIYSHISRSSKEKPIAADAITYHCRLLLPCETGRPRSFSHARMKPRPYMDVRTYGKTPHTIQTYYITNTQLVS